MSQDTINLISVVSSYVTAVAALSVAWLPFRSNARQRFKDYIASTVSHANHTGQMTPSPLWRYWELPAALICMVMARAAMRIEQPGLSDHWHILGVLGFIVALIWFAAALMRRR